MSNAMVTLTAELAETLARMVEDAAPELAAELRKPGPTIVVVLR